MSKRQKGVTIYEKQKGKGWYGDFRRLGGKLEALIPKGEKRATPDRDIAQVVAGEHIATLKSGSKPTREQEAMVGPFAKHHLEQKQIHSEASLR